MDRLSIPVMRVLNHLNHQKRHDCRAGIDNELPGIRPAEKWAGHAPQDDAEERQRECGGTTELTLDPTSKAVEDRALWDQSLPDLAKVGPASNRRVTAAIFVPLVEGR